MDKLTKIVFGNTKNNEEMVASNAYFECKDYIVRRQNCWNQSSESKNTDSCFEEELAEKKCLSSRLCPDLYKKFYEYTECHLWAGAFRNKNDQRYVEARARIESDRALVNMCRDMGHDLTKEISKYSRYRPEASAGESFLKKEGLSR